ncbi:MAG: tetratricopeptide repeat protein, partial [Clostridia bacterium]|nr:tetratricopeptide repeat protein [Clostridia bacterium]
MIEFLCKKRGEHDLEHKPRVYFTCHPLDFKRSFDEITDSILDAQGNCAIYYTADMTAVDEEMYTDATLGGMNLFVIPVSFRLLTDGCRAFERDLTFAKERNIPILPIMLEDGIDELYSSPAAFGERQYLSPYSTDTTGLAYGEKLQKYLSSVLVGTELAERVRAAFDAYVFLSYRKKDRAYADRLMRIIHANPRLRDVAIWYDEFLTPGESFRENIFKILDRADLFALLVTPSLLEDGNFVMTEEYPAAKESGKPILPMEMAQTDRGALSERYTDIPDPINPSDDGLLDEEMSDLLFGLATEKNNSQEHNFLIGLAYLDGIDVEVNREMALELITSAAEAGLGEAMEKLYEMYYGGDGVALDYRAALYWLERLYALELERYGEDHEETLNDLTMLTLCANNVGDYALALSYGQKNYEINRRLYGDEHTDTLCALANLAMVHYGLGEYQRALDTFEEVYEIRCRLFGRDDEVTLSVLNNIGVCYSRLYEHGRALEISKEVYEREARLFGEESKKAAKSLTNLACSYGKTGDFEKAISLGKKGYELLSRLFGDGHPETQRAMLNLAGFYHETGEHERSLELNKLVYESYSATLGEEHPHTLIALFNIASTYAELDNLDKAIEIGEMAYGIYCRTLGEEHPSSVAVLETLAHFYSRDMDNEKSIEYYQRVYGHYCRRYGEEHFNTYCVLDALATAHDMAWEYDEAIELYERLIEGRTRLLGEENVLTRDSICKLAALYTKLRDYPRALELRKRHYYILCRLYGEMDNDTLDSLVQLALLYKKSGR